MMACKGYVQANAVSCDSWCGLWRALCTALRLNMNVTYIAGCLAVESLWLLMLDA